MGPADLVTRIGHAPILDEEINADQALGLLCLLSRAHHASRQARTIGALAGGVNCDELLAASLTSEALSYVKVLTKLPGSTLDPATLSGFLPGLLDGHEVNRVSSFCIDLAARFAAATDACWDERLLEPMFSEVGEFTRRPPDTVASAMKNATVVAARDGAHFNLYRPAIYLMSPGPRVDVANAPPKKPKAAPKLLKIQTNQASRPVTTQQPRTKPDRTIDPTVDTLDDALKRIAHGGNSRKSATMILRYSLRMICDHIKVQLAVLWICDKRSGQLALRLHHGLKLPSQLIGHPLDPLKNPLFERLLESQLEFHWLAEKHQNSVGALPQKLLGTKDGLFFSLHTATKPTGIIMACRPIGADHITPDQCKNFNRICKATADTLAPTHRIDKSANGEPRPG